MRRVWLGFFPFSLAAVLLLALPAPETVYPERPPSGHTGGFGEPTCHRCHFDHPLNAPGGSLTLEGFPQVFTPGGRYLVTVRLAKPEMQRGGFQLSTRFAGGMHAGEQAGVLHAVNERVEVVEGDSSAVQYAEHTKAGTTPGGPESAQWVVAWVAPDGAGGAVVLHVAANAANDDASEFGDFIYLKELSSTPGKGRE